MMRYIAISAILVFIIMVADARIVIALDLPHNETNEINCYSCHMPHNYLGPSLTVCNRQNVCETINVLCKAGCHYDVNPYDAPLAETHQDQSCAVCHNPHIQEQQGGRLIRAQIETPNSGLQGVTFTDATNPDSFADGVAPYNGICEVCHTMTNYHKNNADGDHNHHIGEDCTDCHKHISGLSHGGGGGADCGDCHGSSGSHAIHIADDRGPDIGCGDCHDTDNFPDFADGNELLETNVCDDCHSLGGTYNGVNTIGNSVGAKDNWSDGVYNGDYLASGKEKWCVGCHDDVPAVIDMASAPNVSPFWTVGHGRSATVACENCHDTTFTHIDGEPRTYAFDSAYYSQSGVAYQAGYRLGLVNGEVPLMIPANYGTTFGYSAQTMKDNAFRLCFDCHDKDKLLDNTPGNGIDSNFKASLPNPPRNYSYAWGSGANINEHVSHIMNYVGPFADSDWDIGTNGAGGSNGCVTLMACSSCHNVHGVAGVSGSTNEVMVRDGSLVVRTGYGFSYVIEDGAYPQVTSTGATQATSVGAIFRSNTGGMCGGSMCHDSPAAPAGSSYNASGSSWGTYIEYYRPWQDYGGINWP